MSMIATYANQKQAKVILELYQLCHAQLVPTG